MDYRHTTHRPAGLRNCMLLIAVLFFSVPVFAQPTVTSFSPASGPVGTSVTITGTNFSAIPVNNIVFFGAVKANVTASTATSLTVTVPAGATYQPITVTVGGLTAYAPTAFVVSFPNGFTITNSSFEPKTDYTTDLHPNDIAIADFDGDGKPDMVTANNYISGVLSSISVLRNISSAGSVSFAPKQDFVNGAGSFGITAGDIDGDGKPDIVVNSNFDSKISVFRNTSVAGTISFAPKVDLTSGSNSYAIVIRDVDGDGKADVSFINNISGGLSVYRNTGSIGTIAFAARQDFATALLPYDLESADFDGDGKADFAVSNNSGTSFSIFRNISSPGNVSFATQVDIQNGTGNKPFGLAVADLNSDGKNDIGVMIQNGSGSAAQLFRNTSTVGALSFTFSTSVSAGSDLAYHLCAGDVNGDGKPDVALGSTQLGKTVIFQNNSTGSSINMDSGIDFFSFSPYTVVLADLDADSKPELLAGDFIGDKVSVFRNRSGLPKIISFNPVTAGTGITVTINGNYFTGATAVSFGGVPASSFNVVNSSTITAVVGSGISGDVMVTTPLGTSTLSGFIFAAPPVITSFNPAGTGSGMTVTITGANFNNASAVSFGGTPASSFIVVNPTTITAVVGAGTSGSVGVTTPFGTGTLAGFTFIPAPIVTQFTPVTGGTGTIVTITGTNFQNASAVTFGGIPAASFIVNSATSITATVANGGTGDVAVITPGGTGSLGFFFYPPPAILSISPVTANVGSIITILGTGFSTTPAGNTVFFGQVKGVVQTATATQLTVTVPIGAAYGPVAVTIDNLSAFSTQHFIPSFAGGAALNEGSFTSVFDSLMPNLVTKFVMADYDGDSKPDLGFTSGDFKVFRNLSTVNTVALAPRQQFPLGTAPSGGAVGDFNGDGKPDIVASNFTSTEINVLRNISVAGTINFAPKVDLAISSGQPVEVVVTDVDKDGKADIVAAVRNPHKIIVFRNTSVGNVFTFASTSFNVTELPAQMVSADIDGDMKPDLAYTNGSNTNLSLMRNTSIPGTISFEAVVNVTMPGAAGALSIGDIDNDGKPELITVTPVGSLAFVTRNTSTAGNLSFAGTTLLLVDNDPGGITIADVDGDGKPDLLSTSINVKTCVLRNTSSTGNISFEPKRSYTGWSYVMGTIDLNVDGKTDVVESESFGTGRVLYLKNQVGGPVITSFAPASGFTGSTITITGSDLTGATVVRFGGTPAASFTVVNPTTITAVVAVGASGNVEVITPGGTATRTGFTYIGPPVITSFTPTIATTNNLVVITGTDLAGATAVSFGGVPASSFGSVSSTTVNAIVGTGATGDISVTTPAGTATKSGFTYAGAPAITSFTPTAAATGTTVTITGVNFLTVSNVFFGGTSASSVNLVNTTTITAVVGFGSSGSVLVASTNGSAILPGFTYIGQPTMSLFSPTSGTTGTVVTITGTNFTGATAVSFGGIAASSFTVVNATTITAVVGAGASGSISVVTPGGTASLAGFTYNVVTAVGGVNSNNSSELIISPNPANDQVMIKHPASLKNAYLKLIDINGRTIKQVTIGRNITQTSFSVKGIANGVYKLIWSDDKKRYRRTIMITH